VRGVSLGVLAATVLAVAAASAQPGPCDECVRGDAIIERFSLQPVRPLAGELSALALAEPLTPEQYARVIELRQKAPALARLGAVDDADLALVAAALCHGTAETCTAPTTHALRCLADRCEVALPHSDHVDVAVNPGDCDRYITHKGSPRLGLGFDWGTGVHRSGYPNDGRVWSMGLEGRFALARRIGLVARIDRWSGRDEATDADGNGRDDAGTGSIIRVSALAGPSIVLSTTRFESTVRFLRLDLLGGYLATRSPADTDGLAAGFDLAYQFWALRTGVRVVHGFGDDTTMMVVHLGFVSGTRPDPDTDTSCNNATPAAPGVSSRLALGFDIPFGGFGFSSQLGYLATGLGIEAIWHMSPSFDAMVRGDLVVFPGEDRDRVLHQAALAGLRIDPPRRPNRSSRTGVFGTLMAGYTHGAGLTPTTTGSGPVVDVSLAWGGQGREGAAYFRLHGRFGVGDDNTDYRAVFLSGGFEFRFDGERWRDRI